MGTIFLCVVLFISVVQSQTPASPNATHLVAQGTIARKGAFPYHAVVRNFVSPTVFHLCGGSIISDHWIVTAAHCLQGNAKRYEIIVGTNSENDNNNRNIQSFRSTTSVIHPDFRTGFNDIALIRTPQPIQFNQFVSKINLPSRIDVSSNQQYAGKVATVIGFGKVRTNPTRKNEDLRYANLYIIRNEECAKTWKNIVDTKLCGYGAWGQGPCSGDSGGSLAINAFSRKPVLVGITSYGDKNCPNNFPDVYTRVSKFVPWITRVTGITNSNT